MGSARIDSPEVIKEFRAQFLKFDTRCRQAVTGAKSDIHRVVQWLQHDQASYWKHELRRREDEVVRARGEFIIAREGAQHAGKPSYVDEQRTLRRAEAKREEAHRKLAAVKKWATLLEQRAEKLLGPVNQLSSTLDLTTPQAVARLDGMIVNLEEYLRQNAPGGTHP